MLLSTYLILACASLKNYGKKWKVSQDPQKIMLNIEILIWNGVLQGPVKFEVIVIRFWLYKWMLEENICISLNG